LAGSDEINAKVKYYQPLLTSLASLEKGKREKGKWKKENNGYFAPYLLHLLFPP
jgi:hypothetical protein